MSTAEIIFSFIALVSILDLLFTIFFGPNPSSNAKESNIEGSKKFNVYVFVHNTIWLGAAIIVSVWGIIWFIIQIIADVESGLVAWPFILGQFLGTGVFPIICWILYFILRHDKIKAPKNKKKRQESFIESSKIFFGEFIQKKKILDINKNNGVLKDDEYERKYNALLDEFEEKVNEEIILKQKQDLKRKEEQKLEENKELKRLLDKALSDGVLTNEEYNLKVSELKLYESEENSKDDI